MYRFGLNIGTAEALHSAIRECLHTERRGNNAKIKPLFDKESIFCSEKSI